MTIVVGRAIIAANDSQTGHTSLRSDGFLAGSASRPESSESRLSGNQ